MRVGVEIVPVLLNQPTSDVKFAPTDDGQVALVVVHDGKKTTILATPQEAEGLGLGLIKAAVVAHLKRRAAVPANGVVKPA